MSNLPIDPNLLPLVNGVRPYLGNKARNFADMYTGMIKLLTGNSGKEVLTTMSRILAPRNAQALAEAKGAQAQMYTPNIAFTLFLILILLILATGGMGLMELAEENAGDVDICGKPAVPDDAIEV